MDVGGGRVVPRVSESSSVVDETLIGDLGAFDGGEEIIIEVVGSDVFVDGGVGGVGGDQFGENGVKGLGGKGEILVNGDVVAEVAVTAPPVVEDSGGEVGDGGSLTVSGETPVIVIDKAGVEVGFVSSPLVVDPPTAKSVSVSEQVSLAVKEVLNCKGEVLEVKSACLGVESASVEAVCVESGICSTIVNAEPRNLLAEGDNVVVKEEDSLHLKSAGTNSKAFDRNLQFPVEDGKLNIKMVGGSSPFQANGGSDLLSCSQQAIMVSSNQGVTVADGVSLIVSDDTSEGGGLSGNGGNVGEDSMICLDVGSAVEHTQVVADYSENNDSLVVDTDKTVYLSGADEVLRTESSILNENAHRVVVDELKVDVSYEGSKIDNAVCAGPEILVKKIQVVSGSEITLTDRVIANPLAEGLTTENAVCQKTCADVVQEVKQVFSFDLEREVSGMYIEEATGKEPGYVTLDDDLSCSVTENHLKVEKETVNSLKSDISIGTKISDKQAVISEIRGDEEMIMEDALTSESDDYVNGISFRWEDQHLKAIGSSVNDVAQGQEDMRTPLDSNTISRADIVGTTTSLNDKKYDKQSSDDNMMYDDISLSVEEDAKGANVYKGVTSEIELVPEVNNDLCTMDGKHNVFFDTHGEKNLKNIDSGSVMGKLVETMDMSPSDDVKKSKEENLEENACLPYQYNGMDADVEGIDDDDDVDLHFSCLDEISAGNCTGVDSRLDCSLGVEVQYNDVEHVDLPMEQGDEVHDLTLGIENSNVLGEIIPEQMSPVSGNGVTKFHTCYLLPPKNDGEFAVSDLVWGKVRSHPWWPGQIFDPADASEKAMKYHKKDCFLVAYFGDRTFAWNDASLLRPFRTHFSQIEKQSNSEAFQHAVNSALAEVSRRVELGLSCSCIHEDDLEEIESQIIENTGIHEEAGTRYGVDESTGVSCFEPEKLVDNIRSLALLPSGGGDQLELVIAKAQLSAFSHFRGHRPLPEFQLCEGLLENDVNTSELSGMNEKQIKGETDPSNKCKHNLSDSRRPSKKERSLSELMGDRPNSSDGEDEPDGNAVDESITSAGRKRKARDSVTDKSNKRISFYAAKVSSTPSPKPSFKVGECIRRVASQLTGSSLLSRSNSEKFLKVDDSVDHQVGFDVLQTPVYSPRGRIHSPEHSSLDEMLSQLHLAARDPMKGYSFLNTITTFFSDFRHSVVLSQTSRKRNSSTGRGGRKKKEASVIVNSPEDFEFDDVNDSYWTDRIVQNYAEEELSHGAQNGDGEYQLVTCDPDKPLKSGRKSRKRASCDDHELEVEEPADHIDEKRQACSPTELILNFTEGNYVPSELNLNKIFRRFGPLRESETEIDRQTCRAKVVFKKCSDAEVALSSSGKFNIFGTAPVTYELSYVPSAPFKSFPPAELQPQDDMT